ncbi:hypothetical protein CEXT_434321 [Caerostris extrusa]|uniref:Uncharacterized protein n=1 Tax=Caerostris extrusa TaxID=172846 RepID=A0AAV4Y598_CAEEX|nr:hypothetical protein CEXT_434321 [Caerostris extrusa]
MTSEGVPNRFEVLVCFVALRTNFTPEKRICEHSSAQISPPGSSDTDKLEEIVTYLKSGSDVSKRGVDGNTALHLAALNPIDNFKTISTLIKFGSDVNAENSDQEHSSAFRCDSWKKRVVIYLLLNEGADINHQDSWGNTALHYSVDSCSYWKKTNRNHQCPS